MNKLLLNLVVCNLNDGGDLFIDNGGDVNIYEDDDGNEEELTEWKQFGKENDDDIETFEVSLENGLQECDDYFTNYGERSQEDKEKWNKLKLEYCEKVKDKVGKFYIWGVEYDCDLMFVED